jgi:hypothetical protein
MRKLQLVSWIVALVVGLLVGGAPPLATAAPAASPAPPTLVAPPPAERLPEDANRRQLRYAEREAASPRSAEFKGGDSVAIYIGGGAVTLVLLIVLIVVLI